MIFRGLILAKRKRKAEEEEEKQRKGEKRKRRTGTRKAKQPINASTPGKFAWPCTE